MTSGHYSFTNVTALEAYRIFHRGGFHRFQIVAEQAFCPVAELIMKGDVFIAALAEPLTDANGELVLEKGETLCRLKEFKLTDMFDVVIN